MTHNPIPERIDRSDQEIVITWSSDHVGRYPARALRLHCPCAGCRDERTGVPRLDPATVPDDVTPLTVRLIGNYAIRIDWSDGHGTGIYTYKFLESICECDRCKGESGQLRSTP